MVSSVERFPLPRMSDIRLDRSSLPKMSAISAESNLAGRLLSKA